MKALFQRLATIGAGVLATTIGISATGALSARPVGAEAPIYNTAFITDAELADHNAMSAEAIRAFLVSHNSYFQRPIPDVDGVVFDPADTIYAAAQQYRINPKVLLATLEKEQDGVTTSRRPSDRTLRFLTGCLDPSTARAQLTCTAERLRAYDDQILRRGATVSGWQVGVPKRTEDGVVVTPANRAVAGQFTYTPYAGAQWGGNQPQWGGVYLYFKNAAKVAVGQPVAPKLAAPAVPAAPVAPVAQPVEPKVDSIQTRLLTDLDYYRMMLRKLG
jgi:hypothetical protein